MIVLDTMRIGTRDFTLDPHANLDVKTTASTKTGEIKNERFIGMTTDGSELLGTGAIVRGTIEKVKVRADMRNGYLSVTFSPSLIKSNCAHNMETVAPNDFMETCGLIEACLKESGVHVSVNNCSMLRVDVARDRQTRLPFKNYLPVFHSMRFKRGNDRDFPTSYYNGNKQHTIFFYDKLKACRVKAMALPTIYQTSSNVMRCEYRMLTRKKIEKATSIRNVGELSRAFDVLEDIYNGQIKSVLNFTERAEGTSPPETVLGVELEKLRALKKLGRRNVVGDYLGITGLQKVQEIYGGIDDFLRTVVDESLLSRQNAYPWKKKFAELSQIFGRLEPDSLPGLLCELSDQFLKAA